MGKQRQDAASSELDVSVVICAYSDERVGYLSAAIESALSQTVPAAQIIVVIDHNPRLFQHLRAHFQDVMLIENRGDRGLSSARNTGIARARGSVIAFLDDDAVAAHDWLQQLLTGYADPHVCGVGGLVEPAWLAPRPRWLPREFDWVVGCSYRGIPESRSPVRNLIGANMSFRREVFETIGGFRSNIGRRGTRPFGCEETEFCVRAHQRRPSEIVLYEPRARVQHVVPPSRTRWRYFVARCYAEGVSKAQVAHYVGARDALSSERVYAFRTLPRGIGRDLACILHGDATGLVRAGVIVAGLALTSAGYVRGMAPKWTSVRVPFAPAKLFDRRGHSSQPRTENPRETVPPPIPALELFPRAGEAPPTEAPAPNANDLQG